MPVVRKAWEIFILHLMMKSLELATSSNNMGLKCKDSMDSPCFAIKKGTPLSPLNQIINFKKK